MASNRKFLLLCTLVVGAVAVPVSRREQCARTCGESDFSLTPGNTYTYDYETTTTTSVLGSSRDKTQIQLTAQVDIEVLSKCDLSLRLRGVTLKLSDPESPDYLNTIRGAREFARSVERHILRFSFQNGKVEHVCPSERVPAWVTNIQKGVLSAFQTRMLQPDWSMKEPEIDVLGKCTAEYQSLGTSWQGTHTIRKLKDLTTCTDRENVETFLQGTPYDPVFTQKSLPVVKGSQECEQVIGQGFLQSSTCREKLVFRPFSNGGSSVVTSVVQKLSYATTSQRSFTGNDYRPTIESLLYQHATIEEDPSRKEDQTIAALRELCDASQEDISISVPRKFSAFVYKMKKLPVSSLKSIYQRIDEICPQNTKARKFFMDAIPMVATPASSSFMYEMISQQVISESESNFWLTSLSFVNEPTADIIAIFTPLLDGRREQALLGVSALVHTFCKSRDCSQIPEVKAAVEMLFRNLGDSCYSPDDKKIITTLKAISNIGILFGRQKTLEECYKNPQIRMETRLAAIQAFRRVDCDVSRENLLETFSNYNEDAEIRIAAYLAVMACPSPDIVDSVKDILMNERINHVGSFIWTHLNALAKSKHPERQDIRNIISNLYLLNKYQADVRKFSTAREATYFLESIDSGFHVDSHMIYSTDSYIPRSAMFNLTVDVFGKTCNLFQIDGRMEGLEHAVENFFGPSGYFPQKNIAKMLREKRSVSYNKIREMDEQFDAKSRFQQTPYGSVDVKVFGTTLWYNQFKQGGEGGPEINLLEIVTKLAEEQEAEYSRSFMFLDTTFVVPMTSGLPLRIAVNGTASVGLKYGGKFDVKSFEHVDILGHIEPSGAIEVASLLTVDAGNAARSGLRVVGTMHSSTVLSGQVEVKNGEVIKVKLNMPRDRIDIFNVKSKVYLLHGSEEKEQRVDKRGETNMKSCTGSTVSKILGVQFCSDLRLPPYRPNSALHPINGPARFDVYIQKTDPKLTSYEFDARWRLEVAATGGLIKHGIISLNTPNSEVKRDVKLEFLANHEDMSISLNLKTPVKKITVNGKLANDEAQKKADVKIIVDDKEFFSVQSELRTVDDKSSITYIPTLEVRIPSRRLVAVSGSAYMKHDQKYTAQLQIEDLTEKPILAKGNLELTKKNRYDGELIVNSFVLDGTVKGYAQVGQSMSSRITAEYKFLEGKMNKINIMGKVRNQSANSLMKYNGQINVQSNLLPEYNTELTFETMQTTGHIENTITVAVGDGARSRIHKIEIQKILRYEGTLSNNKVDGRISVSYPERDIDYVLQLNHENTEKSLLNVVKVQYDTNKHINTEVLLDMSQNEPLSVKGEIKVKYPGRSAALSTSLNEVSPREYAGALSCQWQEGKRASFLMNFRDRNEGSRLKYEVSGEVHLPLRSPITFSSIVGGQRGQLGGFAEMSMGVDKYRVKADYFGPSLLNHRISCQLVFKDETYELEYALQNARNKLSINTEVKMPNRLRITAKFDGSLGDTVVAGSFETLWDADKDTSKRFGLNGELKSLEHGYEGKAVMQVRRRTITLFAATMMQGRYGSRWNTNNKLELEWSPSEKVKVEFSSNMILDRSRQQVESQAEIKTPFFGYEHLNFSLTHMYSNQQWESEFSSVLPHRHQFVVSSSGKYSFARGVSTIDANAKLQNSFFQVREAVFELSHDHSLKELTSKALLRWGRRKQISIDVSGITQPSLVKGSMKLRSPFRYFEDLSTEIVHNYSPHNYRSRFEFQWEPRRKVTMNFEGKHELNGRRRICTIALTGTSPFADFENTAAKITYGNDGVNLNTDLELSWNYQKIVSSFIGSFRNSAYNKNFESKFLLTTPFKNYENLEVSSSLDLNRNSYKANIDAQLPYQSTASLNSLGKLSSWQDIELNAVLISHFPKYAQPQRILFDFVHKLQNSKLLTTLDTARNDNRLRILLIGLHEVSYNARNVEFEATVNTPFNQYEEMKFGFRHNQRGNEYVSKIEGNKNKVVGSFVNKLNFRSMLNFEMTSEITSTEMPPIKLSVVQMNGEGQLEHNSYIHWDNNKRVNLVMQLNSKSTAKEITLKFNTPFRRLREVELKGSYENKNWDHKGSVSAAWDRRNRFALNAELRNYRWRNVNAFFEVTSSIRNHEFYSVSAKYDLTAEQKSADVALIWDASNRKAITMKGSFLHSYNFLTMDFETTTPFEDFDRIKLSTKCEVNSPETSLVLEYERGWRKLAFTGKAIVHARRAQITYDIKTSYRSISSVSGRAMYSITSEESTFAISNELNGRDKYIVSGEHRNQDGRLEEKLTVVTPLNGYRNMAAQAMIIYAGSQKSGEVAANWEGGNVLVKGEYESQRDGKKITASLRSSFEDYRQITFRSAYTAAASSYKGDIRAEINGGQVYEGSGSVDFLKQGIVEMNAVINAPHSSLKSAEFGTKITNKKELKQLTSSIKWNGKEIKFDGYLKMQPYSYEANAKLTTPFKDYKTYSFENFIGYTESQNIDARLRLETPIESLRTVHAIFQIARDDSGCNFAFSAGTPENKFNLHGKLSNRQFNPFVAAIEIDVPFFHMEKVAASTKLSFVQWNNAKWEISLSSPKFSHGFEISLIQGDENLNFLAKLESTGIPSKAVIVSLRADYDASKLDNINVESSVQLFGKVHYLNGEYKSTNKESEVVAKLESPLLPESKAEILATLLRRRGRISDAKLSLTVPSSTHQIAAKFESGRSQMIVTVKVDSNMLKYSSIQAQVKYINSSNRDVETSFTVSTPEMSHSITGSLKNYDGEKFAQLKIDCPLTEILKDFSISASLKHNNYEAMDGSISAIVRGKEVRIAGNMKNNEWRDIEAFVTLNTPFDVLRMLRIDGKFRNNRYQNIESSFQLESSNRNLPSLGLTSKIIRSKGSEEMSLMLRLPYRNYNEIQLLANAHYEADLTSADSRITLTVHRKKYSVSGQYGISSRRISGTTEIEYDSTKWMASGRLEQTGESKDLSLTLTTPSASRYNIGGVYGNPDTRHLITLYYINPYSEKYFGNASLRFNDFVNFEAALNVETPFANYRNIESAINQQYNSQYMSSNADFVRNGRRGFLRFLYRTSRNAGLTLHMGCPYSKLRDFKLSYSHIKKSQDRENSLELYVNREKQFKAELLQFSDDKSHVVLDAPVLSLMVTADSKQLPNGREYNFKSTHNSRVVGFRTSYMRESGQFLHDASFTWDEKADKRISYDFKLGSTPSGRELWCRLDTPARALMLKGNFTKANRAQSGGIDFYWDASRNLDKHMSFGMEHADISRGQQSSHSVKLVIEHPKLPKGITQLNHLSVGPSELNLKSELVYSRNRHQHMLLEIKATDMSQSRDSHYKGEFVLRHPISRLDIRANGELMMSKLESSLQLKLDSVDRRDVRHVREFKTMLNKIMQQIGITVRSDDEVCNVLGSIQNRNGETVIFVEKKHNDVNSGSALLKYNARNKIVEFSVLNSENTGVHASASFPKDSASIKIAHSNRGAVSTDVNVYLGLEQSKILKSQVNWRPSLMRDLRITTGENLRAFLKYSRESFRSLKESVSEETRQRLTSISSSMYEQVTPFADEVYNDMLDIARDVRSASHAFHQMYRNNEFYMRDIVREYKEAKEFAREVMNGLFLGYEVLCNIVTEYMEDLYDSMYYSYMDFLESAQETYTRAIFRISKTAQHIEKSIEKALAACGDMLQERYDNLMKTLKDAYETASVKVDRLVRKYAPYLIDGYYYIKNAADRVRYSFNDIYTSVYNYIGSNKYFVAFQYYANSVADTVQAFLDYEYVEAAQSAFNRIYDAQLIDSIINHPNVEYVSGLANTALRKSVQIYHNLGLDIVVSSLADSATNYAKQIALDTAQELLSEMYQVKGGAKFDFAPQRGYMAFEVHLPTPRNSLMEVFDIQTYPEYKKIMTLKDSLITEYYEDFCVWDFYYKLVRYFTPSYWLPSFTAHAMIAGNQHFITFDKHTYDFAGKCSYLLARDFVDGNFSVIVNYGDNHMRKSLTILTEGKKIDVASDYKITLDDVKVEAPLQVGKTIIMRENHNVRIDNEAKGFSILCNFIHNYCSLSISGFYYGKTGGLFGTFNYEPKLDMMTPTRHLADDVESFVNSWEVGQTVCKSSENMATLPSNNYRVQERCRSLFSTSISEFRACFKQVDPEPYLMMCINDLSARQERHFDEAICESAAAYFMQCKMEGVALSMPRKCVRCEKLDGSSMIESEALKFSRSDPETSADVVFLVEEKSCNKERVKILEKVAQSIENNYKQKGLRDVRYTVVAFGGSDIHSAPHVHTMDGQISGALRSIGSAIQSLKFGDGPNNVLEALRFAASLNFRPGTTKNFILMKCSTCKTEEVKAEYGEMVRTLIDGDISLHLLMEQKYEMKVPIRNTKAKKVIGVDKNFAYTIKDLRDSKQPGDEDLLAQLKIPKDVCIPLAFEVNGSSFDVQYLTETKKNNTKKFIDVFARRVVQSTHRNTEWGMCCECIATVDGVGKTTCQRCVSAEIANMISAETSGVFMYPATQPEETPKSSRPRKHKTRRNEQ